MLVFDRRFLQLLGRKMLNGAIFSQNKKAEAIEGLGPRVLD
jgi:hypothetical protein